jgi:hypothetical protein
MSISLFEVGIRYVTLGPLHTRDWEPVTITLQALSLVEKEEPLQVRFTLHLRDQQSTWMQDGCKVYMDSYMAPNGPCFMVTWTIFKNPPLGGRSNTKPWDHGTLNAHNRWFILFYHVWGPAWIETPWNDRWLRALSHMTAHYTWGSVTTLHDFGGVLGWPLDTWSRLLVHLWSGPYAGHFQLHIRQTTFIW